MSKLAEILQNEVAAEVSAIAAAAQQKADALVAEATAKAETLVAAKRRALEAELAAETKRAESGAELLLNQAKLGAKGEMVSQVKSEAKKAIATFAQHEKLPIILQRLADQALEALGSAESVAVAPAFAAHLEGWAQAKGLKLVQDASLGLGVRINANGGKSSVQNALEDRLESAWDALSAKAAKAIWG